MENALFTKHGEVLSVGMAPEIIERQRKKMKEISDDRAHKFSLIDDAERDIISTLDAYCSSMKECNVRRTTNGIGFWNHELNFFTKLVKIQFVINNTDIEQFKVPAITYKISHKDTKEKSGVFAAIPPNKDDGWYVPAEENWTDFDYENELVGYWRDWEKNYEKRISDCIDMLIELSTETVYLDCIEKD